MVLGIVLLWLVTSVLIGVRSFEYRESYLAKLSNDTVFLVHRGKYHQFPNEFQEEAALAVGVNISDIHHISVQHLHQLQKGENIPVLHVAGARNIDSIMSVVLTANKILQGRFIENFTLVGGYINPDILSFHGRYLLSTCLTWKLPGLNEGKPQEDRIQFRWVNLPLLEYHTEAAINNETGQLEEVSFLGLNNHIQDINNIKIMGQDPRFIPISDDRFYVTFNNRYSSVPGVRMGLAEMYINKELGKLDIRRVVTEIEYPHSTVNEKNWAPFTLSSPSATLPPEISPDIYFVQNINPLRVVKVNLSDVVDNSSLKQRVPHYLVSEAPLALHGYRFGTLRGGTNVVDLGDRYIAFFHSVYRLSGSFLTTYWFGCYTFTKNPPYRLLGISPEPIMHETLYQGQWHPVYRNRYLDYVVFPMGLKKLGSNSLLLVYGHQDLRGYSATFDTKRLLQSLDPVLYCDTLLPSAHNYAKKREACDASQQEHYLNKKERKRRNL
jgi:hypothetical protein